MTPEDREKILNLIQKLEFNGQIELANILRGMLMLADSVPELRERVNTLERACKTN